MKVLVVSHNVFSKSENMGKTLSSYFEEFSPRDIAQFYIHSEIPTTFICENYYRITDINALKSIFLRKCGEIFNNKDIVISSSSPRTDRGRLLKTYEYGRKRTPIIYFIRNTIWNLSAWNNKKFREWVNQFNPDIVFFASGDYSFMYKIALKVAKKRNIPLVMCCMDDYYINNKNINRLFGKITYKCFMKQVKKTLEYTKKVFCICDKMSEDYSSFLSIDCMTLHTSTVLKKPLNDIKFKKISYLGNLGFDRYKQLIKMGNALKEIKLDDGPHFIDVYSSEKKQDILKLLTEENGIRFHGQISSDEVKKVIGESIAVIHTESFDKKIADRVRYSVSTKIADSLASGTCLIAFGPGDVASIEYLKKNSAAYCITDETSLKDKLKVIIEDSELREKIVKNALKLAAKNHNSNTNGQLIKKVLTDIVKESV